MPHVAVKVNMVQPEVAPFDPPTRKPYTSTKHGVDRTTGCRDMAIRNFPRWRPAAILDLVQPEVAPFDLPTPKTLWGPSTKHEVDLTTRCRDYGHSKFFNMAAGAIFR